MGGRWNGWSFSPFSGQETHRSHSAGGAWLSSKDQYSGLGLVSQEASALVVWLFEFWLIYLILHCSWLRY